MKIGLVGFAGSGKTTVFNTMTGQDVPVGYGGEVRLGNVRVPDERIARLSQIFSPKKTTYAEMSFCDVPGEHGADKRGLSPRGLQQIRDQEALCLVLRDFDNPALEGDPDPLGDLEHARRRHRPPRLAPGGRARRARLGRGATPSGLGRVEGGNRAAPDRNDR